MKKQIIRKSLAEEVSVRIQDQVIAGEYNIDDQLPTEPVLMKEFGVGRSSIREAVRILENKGIVRVHQGVGTFVASKTAVGEPLSKQLQTAHVNDISEVRELLEIKIAEKAAVNRTNANIEAIREALNKRNEAADQNEMIQWLEADIRFHISIAEASKNPILTELYKTFAEQELKSSIAESYSGNISMHRLTAFHEDLLTAIINQHPERAVKAILQMRETE